MYGWADVNIVEHFYTRIPPGPSNVGGTEQVRVGPLTIGDYWPVPQ